jgi:hypothetical protein
MKRPKFTTSDLGDVPGDIRINLSRRHPLKFRRLFLGLHVDFSTHQLLLYMGIMTLFIEIYGPYRENAVIDRLKPLLKFKRLTLEYHDSNYSKHFFNIGITFEQNEITLFLWQLRLNIKNKCNTKGSLT